MLEDYINAYIHAIQTNNTKEIRQIEAQLAQLGMDRYTLLLITGEKLKKSITPP